MTPWSWTATTPGCERRAAALASRRNEVRRLRQVRVHDLHRHDALQAQVAGAVDAGHAAASDALEDLVTVVDEAAGPRVGRSVHARMLSRSPVLAVDARRERDTPDDDAGGWAWSPPARAAGLRGQNWSIALRIVST